MPKTSTLSNAMRMDHREGLRSYPNGLQDPKGDAYWVCYVSAASYTWFSPNALDRSLKLQKIQRDTHTEYLDSQYSHTFGSTRSLDVLS